MLDPLKWLSKTTEYFCQCSQLLHTKQLEQSKTVEIGKARSLRTAKRHQTSLHGRHLTLPGPQMVMPKNIAMAQKTTPYQTPLPCFEI